MSDNRMRVDDHLGVYKFKPADRQHSDNVTVHGEGEHFRVMLPTEHDHAGVLFTRQDLKRLAWMLQHMAET